MIPEFTAKEISNLSKKLIKHFVNDNIVNNSLSSNPFFIELFRYRTQVTIACFNSISN